MDIGIPKEARSHEHRVALAPGGVKALAEAGHRVFVETGAGAEAGHADSDYEAAGASVVFSRMEVIGRAELLLGVFAPDSPEYDLLRPGQAVTAFWALPAAHAEDLRRLRERGVTAVGIEVIADDEGHAPVLTSMSEIAGSLAVIVGSGLLLNEFGGRGILLSGAPGVPPGTLVVLGAGTLGRAAARTALGMGAEVLLLDRSVRQLREAQERLRHPVTTMLSTRQNVERALSFADLVVAAPANRGQRAPTIVTRDMLRHMRARSVFMDLSIDMGGCAETSRPTYFPRPVYEVDEVVHFCAPNLPTIAARSATLALTNAVLPYVLEMAGKGFERALAESAELRRGTYLYRGHCAMESLAKMFGMPWEPLPGAGS